LEIDDAMQSIEGRRWDRVRGEAAATMLETRGRIWVQTPLSAGVIAAKLFVRASSRLAASGQSWEAERRLRIGWNREEEGRR
jgi:hypothetical protein